MVDVPWPLTNNPGLKPQEGTGRLVNVVAESQANGSPVWRRAPGATVFSRTPSSGSIAIDFDVNARSMTMFSTFFELVGSSTNTNANSSAYSITYPAGTESGDMVFLASITDDGGTSYTTASGFAELVTTTVPNVGPSLQWKISTGETTAQMVANTSGAIVTLAFSIRGVMSTAPIADAAVTTHSSLDSAPYPADITATTADSLLVTVGFLDDDNATAVVAPTTTTIGGTTSAGYGGNLFARTTGAANASGTVMVGFKPLATTGAITGSTWAVTGGSDVWQSFTFTLRHD